MRPDTPAPIERTTHPQSRIIWFILLLLGLLMVLAFWLSWSSSAAQAQKLAIPSNSPSQPQQMVPLKGIVQIATAKDHSCAVTSGSGVLCWVTTAMVHWGMAQPTTEVRQQPSAVWRAACRPLPLVASIPAF